MNEIMQHTLPPFELERFFAEYEFKAPYLACCSDCEPLSLSELLDLADEDGRARWANLSLGYTETQGLPALREAICSHYHGPAVTPSDIVVCAPQEGVYLAMRALLRPGDNVVCTFPGYQSLYSIAEAIGCSVTRWEPEDVQGSEGAVFRVETLEEHVRSRPTRLVIANFPHNPTGALLSHDEWSRVVEICRSADCFLFSDEMYRYLEVIPSMRLPSAADVYERGISLNGCSKALALPGLRIGWLTCQDKDFVEQILLLHDFTTICSAAPSEVLALIAVRAAPHIIERNMKIIKDNIQIVQCFVDSWPRVLSWSPPVAGSVAFPRVSEGFLRKVTADSASSSSSAIHAFVVDVVEKTGVLLLPASVYGHQHSTERGHFRLGLGRKNLGECLVRLEGYLEQLRTKGGGV